MSDPNSLLNPLFAEPVAQPVRKVLSVEWMQRFQKMLAICYVLFAVFLCVFAAWGHLFTGLSSDQLVQLVYAQRFLAGGVPYVDFVDVNPPLIYAVYTIPVKLAAMTGWSLYVALGAFTLAIVAVSLTISEILLRYSDVPLLKRSVIIASLAVALLVLPFYEQLFGDRDDLLLTLAMPWFILFSPLAKRESIPAFWRYLAAVMAGIGFAFKPFFYSFYLATVCFEHYGMKRRWKAIEAQREHHIVCALGLFYCIVVVIFFRHYLDTVMPLALKTYSVINVQWPQKIDILIYTMLCGYGLIGLAGALLLWVMLPSFYTPLITYNLFLLVAGIISFVVHAGWAYTEFPFIVASFTLSLITYCAFIQACARLDEKKRQLGGLFAVCTLQAIMLGYWHIVPDMKRGYDDVMMQAETGHSLGKPLMTRGAQLKMDWHFINRQTFMLLSVKYWSVNLLGEGLPRQAVGRFHYLWPLPGLLRMEFQPGMALEYQKFAQYLSDSVAIDIETHKPGMIIFDASEELSVMPRFYSIRTWFMRNARFARAFSHYKLQENFNTCNWQDKYDCAYEVYYRDSD